ncbi:hypothetical protein [Streptomyces sp. SID13031]|uniref:hypothetical protein n=1 Tax=Streptomyces sp. SID13031 TaxID=2706046 RepID=UPI001EF27529|nr:hypothetical protein [Streptomyces sp. SID13031]
MTAGTDRTANVRRQARVIVEAPEPAAAAGLAGQAIALRVAVRDEKPAALSKAERALLAEWLTRLADETARQS